MTAPPGAAPTDNRPSRVIPGPGMMTASSIKLP
jgi:hypothetical protein